MSGSVNVTKAPDFLYNYIFERCKGYLEKNSDARTANLVGLRAKDILEGSDYQANTFP